MNLQHAAPAVIETVNVPTAKPIPWPPSAPLPSVGDAIDTLDADETEEESYTVERIIWQVNLHGDGSTLVNKVIIRARLNGA